MDAGTHLVRIKEKDVSRKNSSGMQIHMSFHCRVWRIKVFQGAGKLVKRISVIVPAS